jgi:hypothetical protein
MIGVIAKSQSGCVVLCVGDVFDVDEWGVPFFVVDVPLFVALVDRPDGGGAFVGLDFIGKSATTGSFSVVFSFAGTFSVFA